MAEQPGEKKSMTRALLALACLSAAAPAAAEVSLDLEATVGAQHLGISRVPGSMEPLAGVGDLGAVVLLRLGPIGLGVSADGSFDGRALERFNASGMAGLVTDLLPALRLELLAEVGAADLRSAAELRTRASGGGWNRFYGFRPGLSLKLPFLPMRAGVWGLARWGMPDTRDGGPALGLLGRLGVEF
jgi:hypothetical protein